MSTPSAFTRRSIVRAAVEITTIWSPIGTPLASTTFRIERSGTSAPRSPRGSARGARRIYSHAIIAGNATALAIRVAAAAPRMPISGNGPIPAMRNGLSPLSMATTSAMKISGVRESPDPRSAMLVSESVSISGIARKITRR